MEILFRGKRVDNGEWMYGDLIQKKNGTRQIYSEKELDGYKETFFDIFKVIPETVGQFTGQTDKNGVKIFDGDKLKEDNSESDYALVRWDCENSKFVLDIYGIIGMTTENGFDESAGGFGIADTLDFESYLSLDHFEVISNIHEKEVE